MKEKDLDLKFRRFNVNFGFCFLEIWDFCDII